MTPPLGWPPRLFRHSAHRAAESPQVAVPVAFAVCKMGELVVFGLRLVAQETRAG
jgi:hypothetical protein